MAEKKIKLHDLIPSGINDGLSREELEDLRNALVKFESIVPPEGVGTVVTSRSIQRIFTNIFKIVRQSSGESYAYGYSEYDLTNAITASSSGDTIIIPAGSLTLADTLSVPAGIEIKGDYNTVLAGTITNAGILTGLRISGTVTNTGTLNQITNNSGYTEMTGRLGIGIDPRQAIHADGTSAVVRMSSTTNEYATLQLYTRSGSSYTGYAVTNDSAGDFLVTHDTAENSSGNTFLRYDVSTGDIFLQANAGDIYVQSSRAIFDHAAQTIQFTGTNGGGGEGVQYADSGGTNRYGLIFPGTNAVALANRAADGSVQIRANGTAAGVGGEIVAAEFQSGLVVINQDANDINFRVESVGDANLLFTDGGNNNVGIGTATPSTTAKLHVDGNLRIGTGGAGVDYKIEFDGETNDGEIVYDEDNDLFTFDNLIRSATTTYRRYYHMPVQSFDPAVSGATWVVPTSATLSGWKLDANTEYLYPQADIHADWDAASDLKVEATFTNNVNNAGGSTGDAVVLTLNCYYKGEGETFTKSQQVEVPTIIGQSAQWEQFNVDFAIDYDAASNVVEAGDRISFRLHLNTTASNVTDITINDAAFYYNTTHVGVESGDI